MQGVFAGFAVKRRAAAAALVVAAALAVALGLWAARRAPHAHGGDGGAARGFELAGRVVDRVGEPIAAATVTARTAAGEPVVATTDADGRYRLLLPSRAAVRVRVDADGFVGDELGGVEPPQAGLELSLARRLGLEGVVRANGRPAGGAEVIVAGVGGTRTAQAGPDGTFSFGGLAEGRYALRATRGNEAAYLDGVNVAAVDGGSGVLTVELQPATVVGGTLRDRGGKPIARGEVILAEADGAPLPRSATTDAAGAFRFVAVLPGSYVVTAHADGFYPSEPRTLRVGHAPATLELRLDPGATLHGRVVDERGNPVAGAAVEVSGEAPDGTPIAITAESGAAANAPRLEPSGELGILRGPIPYPPPVPLPDSAPPPKAFVTDADGAFRIGGLPAGRLVVAATHPDFARGTSEPVQVAAGGDATVNVVLSRGVELGGRVSDDRGDPVAGAEIVGPGGVLAVTDGRGEYRLAHVARAMTLSVRAAGYLPGTRAVSPDERGPFDVTLKKAEGRLGGEVVDDRGAPVSGARVEISAPPLAPRWVTTDRGGRFHADGLGPGPYHVVISHADYAPATYDNVAPADDARLGVQPGGGIDGDVRDARSGGVPGGLRLEATPDGGKPMLLPVSRGRFRVTALPPGRVTLTASAPGYVAWSRAVDVPGGDRLHDVTVRDVTVELERGGTVVGDVLDDDGNPVADAEVAAGAVRGRSDRDGNFRLAGVAPGRVRVTAGKGGQVAQEEVEVRADDESRVELRLGGS